LVGFAVATWGLFKKSEWWDTVAIVSAVLALLVLIRYWIAGAQQRRSTPWWNVFVHALGAVGVLVLLIVPSLHSWVNRHVMARK
jgi:hypothetical protein